MLSSTRVAQMASKVLLYGGVEGPAEIDCVLWREDDLRYQNAAVWSVRPDIRKLYDHGVVRDADLGGITECRLCVVRYRDGYGFTFLHDYF